MKRHIMITAMTFLCGTIFAQTTLTQVWRINRSDDRDWFTSASDRRVRSAKYSAATDHVTCISRTETTATLVVLNASNGANISKNYLDPAIVTGGTFPVNMHGVDSAGVTYFSNLTGAANTTSFTIYRLATESAVPTLAFKDFIPALGAGRIGDTFDVSGSGTNTEIWCGTNIGAGPHLVKFTTTDGLTFTVASTLTASGGTWSVALGAPARLGMSVLGTGADAEVWGDSSGVGLIPRKFDATSGAILDEVPIMLSYDGVTNTAPGLCPVGINSILGNKLIASTPGNFNAATVPGSECGYVYNVNVVGAAAKVGNTVTLQDGTSTNFDGTGTAFFDTNRNRVLFDVTNNSISSHNILGSNVSDWNLF